MNIICFHNPDEENAYLSNWYPSVFQYNGITFTSLEQYMMYQKAITFADSEIAARILATDDVREIKALGRAVSNYQESIWNGRRQIIVYRGLLEKFRQNPDMAEQLKNTKDAILAECAIKDTIWGIGLGMTDERRFDIKNWKGQNLLGYTLMEVRDTLSF